MTPEEKIYWEKQVELGRFIASIIKRDPDYGDPKYTGMRRVVNDVTDEEKVQLEISGILHGNTRFGFAPIPIGKSVKAYEQFYWELTGNQLRVIYCAC